MANIFTYGTLMNSAVMTPVVGKEYLCVEGEIEGYARKRLKGKVYPGIREEAGSVVKGVLWLSVDEEGVKKLDHFED